MAGKKTLRIGLVQSAVSGDLAANLRRAADMVRRAARRGAKIVCLQELYRSPYFPRARRVKAERFAETIPGESTEVFSRLAREFGVAVIVPLFEKAGNGRFYNSAAVIDCDGTLLPAYRKVHVPQDPMFYEKDYFRDGDRGFGVYRTRHATFSVLICYDQWFPEAARACVLRGADLLFYPTAIGRRRGYRPPEGDWRRAWLAVQRAHAIANGVHVAAVNRVGREGELEFWGTSFVCDAFGNILKRAGPSRDQVLLADVQLGMNREIREGWGFLRNRRPEDYKILAGASR